MKALPRLTDVNGELRLRVWHAGTEHVFPISHSAAANLGQDLTDAMARYVRRREKTEIEAGKELI